MNDYLALLNPPEATVIRAPYTAHDEFDRRYGNLRLLAAGLLPDAAPATPEGARLADLTDTELFNLIRKINRTNERKGIRTRSTPLTR